MRHREPLHLWALALLGLVRTGEGLKLQRLDLFHSGIKLSHLVVDATLGT